MAQVEIKTAWQGCLHCATPPLCRCGRRMLRHTKSPPAAWTCLGCGGYGRPATKCSCTGNVLIFVGEYASLITNVFDTLDRIAHGPG